MTKSHHIQQQLLQQQFTLNTKPKLRAAPTKAASSGDWAWYSSLPVTHKGRSVAIQVPDSGCNLQCFSKNTFWLLTTIITDEILYYMRIHFTEKSKQTATSHYFYFLLDMLYCLPLSNFTCTAAHQGAKQGRVSQKQGKLLNNKFSRCHIW